MTEKPFSIIGGWFFLTSPPSPLSAGEGVEERYFEERYFKDSALIGRTPLSCGEGPGERSKKT